MVAQTATGLFDSADGGLTWKAIQVPPWITPFGRIIAVDPVDGKTFYSTGEELLYKTTSRGIIWDPILRHTYFPSDRVMGESPHAVRVAAIAVSAADPSVLYAAVTGSAPRGSRRFGNSSFAFVRTLDGGKSWATLFDEPYGDNTCRWAVDLLASHPTDADRLFLARSCRAGSSFGAALNQSLDQGATFVLPSWSQSGPPMTDEILGYPQHIVGGLGSAPDRWYLAINRNYRRGGSSLLRSDDDGHTWSLVLNYRGGGIDFQEAIPGTWTVTMAGLAYDPINPNHVFVARVASPPFNSSTGVQDPPVTSGIAESYDGGVTWADLGSQQLGMIADLIISTDRKRLYVASDQGVRMLLLSS